MKSLVIQIQPELNTNFNVADALRVMDPDNEATLTEGNDQGAYANITFSSNDIQALWKRLEQIICGSNEFADWIADTAIITCEGESGWDDYLLLRHFDSTQNLDDLH